MNEAVELVFNDTSCFNYQSSPKYICIDYQNTKCISVICSLLICSKTSENSMVTDNGSS